MHHPWRRIVTTPMVGLKKRSHLTKNMVKPRAVPMNSWKRRRRILDWDYQDVSPGSPALETDALPTGPSRQSWINSLNPSSSSAFPTFISGVHHFGVRFLPVWPFFNPTIEEVTFCLCGWCMLGVFVARIHPSRTWMSGSFESVWWNACVHRLDLGLYSHLTEFWGTRVRTHDNSKGKIPSTGKIFLRGESNQQHCIKQDSKPQYTTNELFQPPHSIQIFPFGNSQCTKVLSECSKMGIRNLESFILWGMTRLMS